MVRMLAAEFVGTALLLATVIGSGIMGDTLAGGNAAIALLGNTLATAAALFVLIVVFGPASGAHFNPAVSLGFALLGKLSPGRAAAYGAAQVAGAVVGAVLAHAMFGQDLIQIGANARTGTGLWLGEAVASFALMGTILACLAHRPAVIPHAVALVIAAGYWFTSSTSFANPAAVIARSLTATFAGIRPGDAPAFIVAEVIGMVAAVAFFSWLLRAEGAAKTP